MAKNFIRSKKAQLTVFVVIGIIILGGIVALSLLRSSETEQIVETEAPRKLEGKLDAASLKTFVEGCITDTATPVIKLITQQGGTLNTNNTLLSHNYQQRFYCKQTQDHGCVNELITKKEIEAELNLAIQPPLLDCIDLKQFGTEGYSSNSGDLKINTKIGFNDVNVELDFPISLEKQEISTTANKYQVKIPVPLGKLHTLATIITNKEVTDKFDKEEFMLTHGDKIKILKSTPYPDTTYSLQVDKYTFNFAIEGKDTIENIGQPRLTPQNHPTTCYIDGDCYKNADKQLCLTKGTTSGACQSESIFGTAKTSNKDCLIETTTKKHGTSWCDFDNTAGAGSDYAGNRHYKLSCFDGKINVEPCRDYREELCTEEGTKATCRINRWHTCSQQENQADCENSRRDCRWLENEIITQGLKSPRSSSRCIPEVPPGFKHWEGQGSEVCAMANEQATQTIKVKLSGARYDPPLDWRNSVGKYCTMLGDCGNQKNYVDEITNKGFVSTVGNPSGKAFYDDAIDPTTILIDLPLIAGSRISLTGNEFDYPEGEIDVMLNNIANNVDDIARRINEARRKPWRLARGINIYLLQSSFCKTWQAPLGTDSCNLCGDGYKPCTEYKCKSLGDCLYFEDEFGVGFCNSTIEDTEGPIITYDKTVEDGRSVKPDPNKLHGISGFVLAPGYEPHQSINFTIQTNEPSKCKLGALPNLDLNVDLGFSQAQTGLLNLIDLTADQKNQEFLLGHSDIFKSQHRFSIDVPPPAGILEAIDTVSGLQSIVLLTKIESYENMLTNMKNSISKLGRAIKQDTSPMINLFNGFSAELAAVKPQVKAAEADTQLLMRKIIFNLARNDFTTFVECEDRKGNLNQNQLYLKFHVIEDKSPPKITDSSHKTFSTVPDPFTFQITLNEPSECRYSLNIDKEFTNMKKMECTESFITDNTCTMNISDFTTTGFINTYIKCKDQPIDLNIFEVEVNDSLIFNVTTTFDYTADLIPPFTVNITDSIVLLENKTVIETDQGITTLVLNEKNNICKFSTTNETDFDKMQNPFICTDSSCKADIGPGTTYTVGCTSKTQIKRNVNKNSHAFTFYIQRNI